MAHSRASALGALPGVLAQEAALVVCGEFPNALFLPLLPRRGPGADPVGRTAALLSRISSDFSVSAVPTGWQISRTPGIDMQRADTYLRQDLDAIEEHGQGYSGHFTASVVGPVTWCASVESASGEKLIRDPGALAEVGDILAEAVREHISHVQRIFPAACVSLVVEEPLAAAACTGEIPTASGLNSYVHIDRARIFRAWEPFIQVVRNSRAKFGISMSDPEEVFAESLMKADASIFFQSETNKFLGEQLEAEKLVFWQVPLTGSPREHALDIAQRITSLGFSLSFVTGSLVVVPSPRLLANSWPLARAAIGAVKEVVDLLNDEDRLLGE